MRSAEKIKYGRLLWMNIEHPDDEILESLKEEYRFHELDLEDCLSKTESPKIEEYKNYVFIVFHFPVRNVKTGHFDVEPLNVFIGSDYLITLSSGKLKKLYEVFERMLEEADEKKRVFSKGSGYLLYEIINEMFEARLPFLTQISRFIQEIEEDIFEGKVARDRLYEIMTIKRKIITLKRTILPHAPIIMSLEHLHKRFMKKELEVYFDDIADKIARSRDQLDSMTDFINTIQEANESLISHNTNRVIKILTVFSVLMLPLTFITSMYGMNIPLPLQNHPMSFEILGVSMLVVLVVMLIVFRWRRLI